MDLVTWGQRDLVYLNWLFPPVNRSPEVNFVSYSELAKDVRHWAEKLRPYDLVLGVPCAAG